MLMKNGLLILSLLITAGTGNAKGLELLGERSSNCENLKTDDFVVTIEPTLAPEALSAFERDDLVEVIVPYPNCFRVGTEIKVNITDAEAPYLGRAFISSIQIAQTSSLSKLNLKNYSSASLNDLSQKSQHAQQSVLSIQITEKMTDRTITEHYQRLPSCFASFDDWESLRFSKNDENLQIIKKIQKGLLQAQIWNGALNCFKVGAKAALEISEDSTDYGYIMPTQVQLVHLSRLTQQHASWTGQSLESLKLTLDKQKSMDGGYVSIVVFNYLEPRPKTQTAPVEIDEDEVDRNTPTF